MKYIILFIFLIIITISCNQLKYKSDAKFMNSSNANSFEYPIRINKKMCVDLDQNPGLCVLHHNKANILTLSIDSRPYSYTLDLVCPDLGYQEQFQVPKGKKFTTSFDRGDVLGARSIVCIGEIFPADRELVSAKFTIIIKLVDSAYIRRTKIFAYPNDALLVIGGNALYTTFEGKTKRKKTTIKLKEGQKVYSESYNMRFNAYGY